MVSGVAILNGHVDRLTAQAAPPDAVLAAAGDQSAFERLYRSHVSRIHGLARRMANGQEAEELTQDIFVRAWQKLGTFRGESAFGTWLHRLAVNVILERRRTKAIESSRYRDDEQAFEHAASRPATPDAAMDLESAIDTLPDGARQIFVLHDIEGHKHREIAVLLGISSGTSKTQLHRARMLLRSHLNRVTGSHHAGPVD